MLPYVVATKLLRHVSKLSMVSSTNLIHTSEILHKKKNCGPKKVAVILCGCGALDGTEISEAISVAIHLSAKGFEPTFYAPDLNICGPINHLTKDPEECNPPKNTMIEGARIARPCIKPLCECTPCDNSGLILPGGFGVARTLSDFASKGCNCVIIPELEKIFKEFNCSGKPIGCICIAAALVPKVLEGAKVTLGKDNPREKWPYADAIEKVKQMGANVELRDVKGVTHCKENNVYSTPAWMDAQATFAEVHDGIGKMVNMMRKTMK